jgi:hypothetical protein
VFNSQVVEIMANNPSSSKKERAVCNSVTELIFVMVKSGVLFEVWTKFVTVV